MRQITIKDLYLSDEIADAELSLSVFEHFRHPLSGEVSLEKTSKLSDLTSTINLLIDKFSVTGLSVDKKDISSCYISDYVLVSSDISTCQYGIKNALSGIDATQLDLATESAATSVALEIISTFGGEVK